MKRAAIFVVVLFAASALAQIRGVPASVTSLSPGNPNPGVPASVTSQTSKSYNPGIPASVTSLGPNGWQGGSPFGNPPALPPTNFSCLLGGLYCAPTSSPVKNGFHGHHHDGGNYGYGYGYGYGYSPYYLYPAYSGDYSGMGSGYDYLQPGDSVSTTVEPEPPAPTIFERRPASRPFARDEARYDDSYRGPAADSVVARATHTTIGVGEQDTTTLVFADGHQLDVHKYAIVGPTLFNFDGTGPFKIQLADLNLAATAKINEDHGVEFKLPK